MQNLNSLPPKAGTQHQQADLVSLALGRHGHNQLRP
jgi:hypothetical protein